MSADGGAEDVALESPPFTPTGSTVLLEWDQYFEDYYTNEVFVEVWNGSSWNTVYDY